jgi:Cobalamin biosynthesis protein CbiG
MTGTAVIALARFRQNAERIAAFLDGEYYEYHKGVFAECFISAERIVAVMSAGIVVRSIAPLLSDKWDDPAVVVVTPDLKYAIPVLGGHHGANDIAKELAGIGIVPVISTATEAFGHDSVEAIADRNGCTILNRASTRAVNAGILDGKTRVWPVPGPGMVIAGPDVSVLLESGTYTIGIGCRKGVEAGEVTAAVRAALKEAEIDPKDILCCATTAKKCGEAGLIEGIAAIPANLIFLDDDTINAQSPQSPSKAGRIGLVGVAEPCALATARHRELVMKKKIFGKVTIAIAR